MSASSWAGSWWNRQSRRAPASWQSSTPTMFEECPQSALSEMASASEYIASIGHTRRFSSESLQRTFAAFPFLGSDLHCPGNCGPLRRVFFKGLRLDWCPKCQGLWFDRGELAILLQHYPSLGGGESRSVDAVDLADIVEAIAQFFGSLH